MSRPPNRCATFLWGCVEVSVLLGTLATVAGFLGQVHWLLELASHFRLQLAVALIATASIAGAAGRRRLALMSAMPALVNAALVLLAARPDSPANVPAGAPRLRILSLNVHTANDRADLVIDVIRRTRPDVIVLMEVNAAWMAELAPLRSEYPFELSDPREDNFGVALLARERPTVSELTELGPAEVPSVWADLRLGTEPVRLLGTHPLPPVSAGYAAARNGQLAAVANWCALQPLPVVVVGDLNTTPYSPVFASLLRQGRLTSPRPGWGVDVTWSPRKLRGLGLPLDHCLTGRGLSVVRREVLGEVGSDHRPLLVELVRTGPR